MTLEEFKEILLFERVVIVRHYEEAKAALAKAEIGTLTHTHAYSVNEVWSAKLDMMDWILSQSTKIEITKPKMREFL